MTLVYTQHYQRTKLQCKNIFVIAYATWPQRGIETTGAQAKLNAPLVHSSNEYIHFWNIHAYSINVVGLKQRRTTFLFRLRKYVLNL